MTQLALSYEPFVHAPRIRPPISPSFSKAAALETMIERVRLQARARDREAGEVGAHQFQAKLGEWKQLSREGWDVTVLIAPDSRSVLLLACRGRA